ncbi:cyclin-h [Anaeramoeba flamelloides]|uniref:Cyclin-h n=1 Tax=Anaeramoeba flamelloides TaxID=1746091 RepID=A0ABQ8XMM3_9EUKA|nr:cyclin-h [Anaeramoeba flamelloides]
MFPYDQFKQSTQFKKWNFNKNDLLQIRKETFLLSLENSLEILSKNSQTTKKSKVQGQEQEQKQEQEKEKEQEIEKEKKQEKPTFKESQDLLLYYYHFILNNIKTYYSLPLKVGITSVTYLQRFYTEKSAIDYDPILIFLSAISLASKVEEENALPYDLLKISIDKGIMTKEDCTLEIILKNEKVLLNEIQFHLKIHHPLHFLRLMLDDAITSGFLVDQSQQLTQQQVKSTSFSICENIVKYSIMNEILFYFTPHEISISILKLLLQFIPVSFKFNFVDFFHFLNTNYFSSYLSIEKIDQIIEEIPIPNNTLNFEKYFKKEELLKIQIIKLKIKFFKNPLNDPNSEIYKEKREKEIQNKENDYLKKQELNFQEQTMSLEEIFGNDENFDNSLLLNAIPTKKKKKNKNNNNNTKRKNGWNGETERGGRRRRREEKKGGKKEKKKGGKKGGKKGKGKEKKKEKKINRRLFH